MLRKEIISWLLEGDVSVRYQTCRDLLHTDKPNLRKGIEREGWARRFLDLRQANGYWGKGFYMPKWTSTHYTILDLKNLGVSPENKAIRESLRRVFEEEKSKDGGIYPIGTDQTSDVCVSGMVLNYASYFHVEEECLKSIVDFLLFEKMKDGGFNCQSNRKGAVHSSLHSTLSVLEGIYEYRSNGYRYRAKELDVAKSESVEFILLHKLFRSERTGELINPDFLQFRYPARWHYDILRAMDYFRVADIKYDRRMDEAIKIILQKRTPEGFWKLASKYPGQTHFDMEQAGKPSRWNTLRALRVLEFYGQSE
jgi:hypothetical protein